MHFIAQFANLLLLLPQALSAQYFINTYLIKLRKSVPNIYTDYHNISKKLFSFMSIILHKFIKRYPIHLRQHVRNIESQHPIPVLVCL